MTRTLIAGFGNVLHELRHFDPIWLPVAFGMELAAYFGYVVAYREVARLEGGPWLGLGRAGAIVAAGFGAFVIRGGFVVDRQALEAAGLDPRQARARVLGLGALEYAVLAPAAALAAVILLARGSTHPSLGFTLRGRLPSRSGSLPPSRPWRSVTAWEKKGAGAQCCSTRSTPSRAGPPTSSAASTCS